ncbi:MAG: queuosine precursor transporter, partial [Bacteroidales bacterium]|nr:queuosine precursor transporter [Bacteroidales bacterium]
MNEMIFIGFSLFLMTLNLFALKGGKHLLTLLIVVYTITMNIFVVKQFDLFGLAVTGGNALYGALFLATDLLSEHFGTKDARRSVYLGFFAMIVFVLLMQVLLLFNTNDYDYAQDALSTLFTVTPRIIVGSLLAYFIAQNIDIYIYEWIKKRTNR